jgi:hypothetical protein
MKLNKKNKKRQIGEGVRTAVSAGWKKDRKK